MIRITWYVDEGYTGKARPHYTEFEEDAFEDCETEEERQDIINEAVKEEFEEVVSYRIDKVEEIVKYFTRHKS